MAAAVMSIGNPPFCCQHKGGCCRAQRNQAVNEALRNGSRRSSRVVGVYAVSCKQEYQSHYQSYALPHGYNGSDKANKEMEEQTLWG